MERNRNFTSEVRYMVIHWLDKTNKLITLLKDRPLSDHDTLLQQFYDKDEILIGNSYYRIIGLLIIPPMLEPPDIYVKAEFLRQRHIIR